MKTRPIEYERLPEVIKSFAGVGIKNLTATLVQRDENKAIYKRSDGFFEVFKIKISPANERFGKSFPAKEAYPGNDAFGNYAWCCDNLKDAQERYAKLP